MTTEFDFKKSFGENICRLRREKGITQIQLAEDLNYSDKAVSKWERGESVPDTYTILKIAELFEISTDELLGRKIESVNNAVNTALPKRKFTFEPKQTFIPLISTVGVYFLASIVFFILKNINITSDFAWKAFVYATPAAAIVITVFASMWWKLKYQCMCVSAIIWAIGAAIYCSFSSQNFGYIFLPCAILQCVCILTYVFVYFLIKSNRSSDKSS
ncbi:MAG: helix-turn-helix domain-containing protein [Ruminococcus sp.]|nr:helix-turn-helix domain-containing protein [Ruminococcus sp.]